MDDLTDDTGLFLSDSDQDIHTEEEEPTAESTVESRYIISLGHLDEYVGNARKAPSSDADLRIIQILVSGGALNPRCKKTSAHYSISF
eukprot:8570195-Pyramimonas_sp.AAC.2